MSINYGQYVVPDPDTCVNLAVGQPSNEMLPLQIFNDALINLSKDTNTSLLQYGSIEGYTEFRQCLAHFLEKRYTTLHKLKPNEIFLPASVSIDHNNLFVTTGITGGLSLLLSILSQSGDTIFCEDPTYFIALNIFKDFKLNIKPIKMLDTGLDIEELENKLKEESGERVFLYTIPMFQNPTGINMSDYTQNKLVELLYQYPNLVVFSDEVYQFLAFDGKVHTQSLKYKHDNIISLGSFSKIFAPALRLGWIHSSQKYINLLKTSGQMDSGGCVNPIMCAVMHKLIQNNKLDEVIKFWQNFLHDNCAELTKQLNEKHVMYCADLVEPKGGYFLWLKLHNNMSGQELEKKCMDYEIKFHHGNKFSISKTCENYIRLSFSWYNNNNLVELFGKTAYEKASASLIDLINDTYLASSYNNKLNVLIHGHNGKLGKLIVEKIKNLENDNDIVYAGFIGKEKLINFNPITRYVIVDVTSDKGTEDLLNCLITKKYYYPLIIGSTGDLPHNLIEKYSKRAPVGVSSNFSQGVKIVSDMLKIIDASKWNIDIEETHHIHKKDKPSGTAKTLANIIEYPIENIISVREGECVGKHIIKLNTNNEEITITHLAKDRRLFADGAYEWIKFIEKQKNAIFYNIE